MNFTLNQSETIKKDLQTEYTILINDNCIFPIPSYKKNQIELWEGYFKKYNNQAIKHSQLKAILIAHTHLKWNMTEVDDLI